jgi:dihydrolipoamide dehydrogenase
VVVAVGSAAAIPDVPGLAEARPWTNREATTTGALPASLVVLGGGPVGVEMAQAYAELGVTVTLIEALDRLLAREEEFVAEQLTAALRRRAIDVRLGVSAKSVVRDGATVTVELSDGGSVEGEETSVSRRSGSSPARRSRSMTRCERRACRGCTPSATSTDARC